MRRTIRTLATIALAAVVGAAVATAAGAAFTSRTGTFTERQTFVRHTDPTTYTSTAFTNVPLAAIAVTVPSGVNRMLDARFTAESQCTGGSWCSVRIVVRNAAGIVTELQPASGNDFAFDSAAGGDNWEGHAVERSSYYLAPGSYGVLVQASVRTVGTTLRLDDWHFAVEVIRP